MLLGSTVAALGDLKEGSDASSSSVEMRLFRTEAVGAEETSGALD